MSQSQIPSSFVPRRHKSEFSLRPRPATSYESVPDMPQTASHKTINKVSSHTVSEHDEKHGDMDWQSFFARGMSHGPAVMIDGSVCSDASSESDVAVPACLPMKHVRRSSVLTQSVLEGFSAISRRLSTSRRSPKKEDTLVNNRRPPVSLNKRKSQFLELCDTTSIASSTTSEAHSTFNCLAGKRRPSMPILNSKPASDYDSESEPEPRSEIFDHGKTLRVPISRPSLPDFWYGGDGARASAAAQNEALANARATPPPTYHAATSYADMKDSESGIGITMDDSTKSETGSIHAVRCDPADLLPAELLESIFTHLDAKSLLQAELVCTRWKALCQSQVIWRHVFYRAYAQNYTGRPMAGPSVPGLGKNIRGQDFRKLYSIRKLLDKRWANGEAAAIYLNGHKDSVYCVQFDDKKIVTGSRDNTIRVWDAKTYQCVRKLGPPNNARDNAQVQRVEVEPQGVVPFFKMEATSLNPPSPAVAMWHRASVLCLQYDEDILVTGSSDCSCIVWSIKDNYKPMFRLLGHTAGVLDVCLDSQRIVTCSKDFTIKIWDRFTGDLLKTLVGHSGPVNAVQLRGNLLASASGDTRCKLWRMEDGVCVKEFRSRERGLACVEFSEDGRTIYAGGNDHVIYEYNTITGNIERELKGHTDLVRSLHLDTANSRVVSGSYDFSIKVWNKNTEQNATENPLKISLENWTSSWMLAAKSDYRKIACASQDGRVVIVDFGYGIDGVHLVEA